MLMKLPTGVDFTNILRKAFTCTYPKSVKAVSLLIVLLGSVLVKAARKHVDKTDHRLPNNIYNVVRTKLPQPRDQL